MWSNRDDFVPDILRFDSSKSGIQEIYRLTEDSEYVDYFMQFDSYELVDFVVKETNDFYTFYSSPMPVMPYSKMANWHDATTEEMCVAGMTIIDATPKEIRSQRILEEWQYYRFSSI